MIKIRKKRASVERQLSVLKKKEAKAAWYQKKSTCKISRKDKNHGSESQGKITSMLKTNSSAFSSSSTDDTLILSDSEIAKYLAAPDADDSVCDSQEDQVFSQVPPEMENIMEGN